MAVPLPVAEESDDLLAWFDCEPADDAAADLAILQERLARLGQEADAARHRLLLERFCTRALDISGRLRPKLLAAGLPLPQELHAAVARLNAVLLELASAVAALADDTGRRASAAEAEATATGGLALVGEVFALSAMAALAAPGGMWRLAHRLAGAAGALQDGGVTEGGLLYRRLLAIVAAQPESLSARELSWLFDYLGTGAAAALELSATPPQPAAAAWWFDPAADLPPVAALRQAPPAGGAPCHAHAAPLARALVGRLERLEAELLADEGGGPAADAEPFGAPDADLPLGLTRLEIVSLLRRLQLRWMAPPVRELPRRQQRYAVQVCIGLHAMWALGRGGRERGRVVEWMVQNESPGGYAILSVSATEGEVAPGAVLALRRDASQPWAVCLVRWVRSEGPDQVELGLQVMANDYQSIQVGFRGGELRTMAPALALAAMEPVRRQPAIVAPAGTYVSRRFVFVRDAGQVYVAQGRALGLDMQTASIELFRYETDPYPI